MSVILDHELLLVIKLLIKSDVCVVWEASIASTVDVVVPFKRWDASLEPVGIQPAVNGGNPPWHGIWLPIEWWWDNIWWCPGWIACCVLHVADDTVVVTSPAPDVTDPADDTFVEFVNIAIGDKCCNELDTEDEAPEWWPLTVACDVDMEVESNEHWTVPLTTPDNDDAGEDDEEEDDDDEWPCTATPAVHWVVTIDWDVRVTLAVQDDEEDEDDDEADEQLDERLLFMYFFWRAREFWNHTWVTLLDKPVRPAIRSKSCPSGFESIWGFVNRETQSRVHLWDTLSEIKLQMLWQTASHWVTLSGPSSDSQKV